VRLGTLTGRRRRHKEPRQKEVDVLLAVDMLTHGFNKNMTRAALLAGDLDFRPVVEALVRAGIFVEVWYEKRSGSKYLFWAADQGRPIEWHTLYYWNTDAFQMDHKFPEAAIGDEYLTALQVGCGSYDGGTVELMRCSNRGLYILHATKPSGENHRLKHMDRLVLEKYFSILHGAITWKSLRE